FSFNQTSRALPFADVPAMLRAAAKAHPQRVAVIHGGKRLTYEALFARAASYARAIDSLCPTGNGVVAVCLEKGFPLAAAVVAAAISGNAWLTLPADTPPGRLNEILEDSGAGVLVCADGTVPSGCRAPVLSPAQAELFDSAPYPVKPCAKTAYMVYTSGSTGKPKGVLIGQENLVNLAAAARALYGHGAVLSLCSTGFDVFVMECAVSLMNGRTLVFPEPGQQEDPKQLAALIRGFAVGNLFMPPSRLEAYLREGEFARALNCVESIVCGGERFPGELMQSVRLYSQASVYNQYGPSETTIAVSYKLLNDASAVTIGKPMDNCRLYVLDAHLQPLPIGVNGEVYIGGLCVGQGYKNLPELNEKSFIPSPFELGETLYRSGDVGCWTNDGEIMLGGRMDDQVKLRGLRVEPQEIAMRLGAHEKVSQAAVKLVSRGMGALVVAYYTADREIPEAELTEFLRSYLPVYMLPGAYVRLEAMPVTRSGKIDYLALPEPEVSSAGVEAQNSAEADVLAIFQKNLRHSDLDVESDYFLFGGDSLTAMETLAALEAKFGVKLAVADLFVCRTARRLAALLAPDAQREAAPQAAPADERIPVAEPRALYPATPTQIAIYLDSQSDPKSLAYNMPGAFRLPGNADRGRLLAAFRELISREKLLRTGFEPGNGGLVQRVWDNAAFGIGVLSQESFEKAMRDFIRPFDVTRPPLMRAAFWDSPNGDAYLFFDTHHLVGDGLTSPLLLKKLDALYSNRPYEVGAGFADYALWLAEKGVNARAHEYWRNQLENAPELINFPYDHPETAHGPYPGKKRVFALKHEVSLRAEEYCAKRAATPFMLFAAAYALLLYKLTGAEDMLIGTPVSGRTTPQMMDMLGPFIRTLPLRVRLNPEESAADFVARVRLATLDMIVHQEADVGALAKFARGASGGRIFNALFSMRPFGEGEFSFLGERLSPAPADSGFAKFPLSLEAAKTQGGYSFTLEYASSLIDDETAALWARSYGALVEALVGNDAAPIAQLDPLCEMDRYDLVDRPDRLSTPFADIPLDYTIFHAARNHPDAPAVRFHGETVTYAALKARAEHIARALAGRGLGRGDVVGLVHARTPDMFAALIGIMKAGCAYMPALSNFPAQRLAYMAKTAGAKLVLADEAAAAALQVFDLPCPVAAVNALEAAPGAKLPTLAERGGEDGIYVLFTSGSTGDPKGALNTHAAIANLLEAMTTIIGEQAKSVLCSTNMTFDIFITESLLALALGKCVVLADEEEMFLPHRLAELIVRESVDTAQLTPSRLQMCMGSDAFCAASARLGAMILVGEPLTLHLASLWRAATKAKLYNMYGPTEAAVYVSGIESSGEEERIT
ncbi:MAG TPA: AMP-binding protein, partial [Clostridia bacterium]|nr:AMP-binding protein [Clostridia bacterium]